MRKPYLGTEGQLLSPDASAASGWFGQLQPYYRMARTDHWFKNIFVLPGIALAAVLTEVSLPDLLWVTFKALASVSLVASANYVINEWLDAPFDAHHPLKHQRPAAAGQVRASLVSLEYVLLAAAGLALAYTIGWAFLAAAVVLLVMGIAYNVPPLRLKELPYLDVLSESLNNPIRLVMGWTAVIQDALPPSSILLAFWMGGAFLMTIKRFAEYRFIDDPQRAGDYRRSFAFYSEEKLLTAAFFFALCCAFFLGVFLVKYRIEFLLIFPFLALLFSWYLAIGLRPESPAQTPEKLHGEHLFMLFVVALCALIALLLLIDIPVLQILMDPVTY
jgi:decaprenyl-phosphate phosphoribosyltransferase